MEPLHTQSSVGKRTTHGCSEVISGSLLQTVRVGETGGLLQGAGAEPLHRESRSHPLLHLWRVQKLFSVISGLELTAGPFLSAVAAWLGKRLPGRSEHAAGAAGEHVPSSCQPSAELRILSPPSSAERPRCSLCSRSWGQAKNRTWDLPWV